MVRDCSCRDFYGARVCHWMELQKFYEIKIVDYPLAHADINSKRAHYHRPSFFRRRYDIFTCFRCCWYGHSNYDYLSCKRITKRRRMKGKPKIATKKAKTTNNSISKDKVTKTCTPWIEDYLNVRSMRMHPVTQAFIEDLCKELVAWALDDELKRFKQPLMIAQFYTRHGIPRRTFYKWCKDFPQLDEAYEFAKEVMAARRETGAIIKEYDTSTIAFMQPHYSPEWKDMLEYKAELKAKHESQSQGNVLVQIAPFEDTDVKRIGDKE